ncbi:MAG TPA: hypothetical protein VN651_19715 [Gemmatimonadaceae bacterium]|nr:hypothetical protein [Gemmatimonadaceae bacterium]
MLDALVAGPYDLTSMRRLAALLRLVLPIVASAQLFRPDDDPFKP